MGAGGAVSLPRAPETPSGGSGVTVPSLCGDSERAQGNRSLRRHKCQRLCGKRKGSGKRGARGGGGTAGRGTRQQGGDKQGPIHGGGGAEGTVTVHVPSVAGGKLRQRGGQGDVPGMGEVSAWISLTRSG